LYRYGSDDMTRQKDRSLVETRNLPDESQR
jgi:hypothetical protein